MLQSLYAGVSGLINHQRSMDTIGNNISNTNTVGFKKSMAGFADIMSMNIGGASANPMQVGLGTRVNSTTLVFNQGGIESTNKATDLAISGRGFFVVSNGTSEYYTRNGNFTFNKEGDMINAEGLAVRGRLASVNQYGEYEINQTTPIEDISIPVGIKSPAQPTSNLELGGNLNAESQGSIMESPQMRTYVSGDSDIGSIYSQQGVEASLLEDQPVTFKAHATDITNFGSIFNSADSNLDFNDGDTFEISISKAGVSNSDPLVLTYRGNAAQEYSGNGIPRDLDGGDLTFSTLGGLARKIESKFASDLSDVSIKEGKLQITAKNPLQSFSISSKTVPSNSKFNSLVAGLGGSYAAGDVKSSSEFFFEQTLARGEDFDTVGELASRLDAATKSVSNSAKVYMGDVSEFDFTNTDDRIKLSANVRGTLVTHEYYYTTATRPEVRDTTDEGGIDEEAKPFSTLDELIEAINSDFAPGDLERQLPANTPIDAADGLRLSSALSAGTTITNNSGADIEIFDGSVDANGQPRSITLEDGSSLEVKDSMNVSVDAAADQTFSLATGVRLEEGLEVDAEIDHYAVGSGTGQASGSGTLPTDSMNLLQVSNDGGRLRFNNMSGFELKDIQFAYSGTNVGKDTRVNELLDDINGDFDYGGGFKITDPIGGRISYDNNHDGGFALKELGISDAGDALNVVVSSANNVVKTFVYDPYGDNTDPQSFSSLDELLTLMNGSAADNHNIGWTLTDDGKLEYQTGTALDSDALEASDMVGIVSGAGSFAFDTNNAVTGTQGELRLNIDFQKPGETSATSMNVDLALDSPSNKNEAMAQIAEKIQTALNSQGVTGFKVEWTGRDFLFKNPSTGGLTDLDIRVDPGTQDGSSNPFSKTALIDDLFEPINDAVFSVGTQARTYQLGMEAPIAYVGTDIINRYNINEASDGPFNGMIASSGGTTSILRNENSGDITGAEVISAPSLESILDVPSSLTRGTMSSSERILMKADQNAKLANLFSGTGQSLGLKTNDRINIEATIGDDKVSSSVVVANNLGSPSDTTLADLVNSVNEGLGLQNETGAYVTEDGTIKIHGDNGEKNAILDFSMRANSRDTFNAISNMTELQQAEGGYHSTTVNVIDSESHEHALTIEYFKDPDPRNLNQWKWQATVPEPAQITGGAGSDSLPQGTVSFNDDGSLNNVVGAPIFIVPNTGAKPMEIDMNMGSVGGGFDGFTQYASKSITTKSRHNGFKEGSLEDYVIDDRGVVSGVFSNNQTRVLAQLALADFTNEQGLSKIGGSLYSATNSSGKPIVTIPGEGGVGFVVSSSLEMSNVDLSMEFTQMITIQRGFQSNSRIITTSDEMITELLNMKR